MIRFVLYKIGFWLANTLPLNISYSFASLLSRVQYSLSAADRKAVKKNLMAILGDQADINRLSKDVFCHFGFYLVEFFRFKHMFSDDYIDSHVSVEGLEHIESAVKGGRGAICLTAHLGNWEYGGVLLSKLGYPLTVVAMSHGDSLVDRFFNHQRSLYGNTVVPTSQAIKACSQALEQNRLIGIAADRALSSHGENVPFLGSISLLPKGPAMFALKHNAPILPTFLLREERNKFRLIIKEPVYPKTYDAVCEEEQIKDTMRDYLHIIEEMIRAHPTQWMMFEEFMLA